MGLTDIPNNTQGYGPSHSCAGPKDDRTAMEPHTPYRVHEVDLASHIEPVCEVWQRNLEGLAGDAARRKARRGYLANPAGQGSTFLLHDDSVQAHRGVICLHERRFFRGTRPLTAANLADFAVDRNLRTVGPALMLMRHALRSGAERAEVLYGLPNTRSLPICKRAGLHAVGHKTLYAGVLSSAHPHVNRLPRPMRPLARAAGRIALAVAHRWDSGPPGWHCREEPLASPHLDRLWGRRDPSLLTSERSATMLAWRFQDDGRPAPWRLSLVVDQGQVPQGYVVWSMHEGVMEIGDFFLPAPRCQTRALWRTFMAWARHQGGHSIWLEFLGPPEVHAQLLQAGLRQRGQGAVLMGAASSECPEFVTLFDSDD